MDEEFNYEGHIEEENFHFSGLHDFDEIMEEDGQEDLDSSTPQVHGSFELDGEAQPDRELINMADLPTQIFSTREELIQIVRDMALKQGFVIVTKRSKKNKYVVIICDLGGTYRDNNAVKGKRKKRSGSRLINCPFEIWGKKNQDGGWRIEIKDLSHNHTISSDDISGHPYARRFTEEEVKEIKELTMAGIAPRQILTKLRKGKSNYKSISRTLYNLKAKLIKESLAGRSMIQALMEELGQGGFIYDVECDQDGHVTHLLFSHPKSTELVRNYPTTFVMDCTYKTNKYKMPLLDIVGVTSFNTSFFCGFAFIHKEEEKDYVWALQKFSRILGNDKQPSVIVSDRELALMNAIKFVFPDTCNLLCVWHIEKNILAKCKPCFEDGDDWELFMCTWTNLIDSPTKASFDEAWKNFQVEYAKYEEAVSYIRRTWIPWKKFFVAAWANEYMHLGHHVSSRGEASHSNLKMYLQVSNGDLRTVKEKICHAVENQFIEIKAQLSSEKIRVAHNLRIPFFKKLIGNVSRFALEKLLQQLLLVSSESLPPICTGHFAKSMGLPCAHMIKMMKSEELELEHIHPQWRIGDRSILSIENIVENHEDQIDGLVQELQCKYQQLPLNQKESVRHQISQFVDSSGPFILEPLVKMSRTYGSSSRKKKNTISTKRDPSEFEMTQKVRKCSVCGDTKHDRRTCTVKGIGKGSTSVLCSSVTTCSPPSSFVDLNS